MSTKKEKKVYIVTMKRNGSFRLVLRTQVPDGRTQNETLSDPRISSINKLYSSGEISESTARDRLKVIREERYRRLGKTLPRGNTDNLAILKTFWADYRKKRRRLRDPDSTYHKFRRAVEMLGPLNLTVASEEEIQNALDARYKQGNHQKIGGALRAILRHIGRTDVDLILDSNTKSEVAHLSADQVKLLAESIDDKNLQTLVLAAFYTGMRVGELMYVTPTFLAKDFVTVKKQKKRDGSVAVTKTGIERKAFIISGGRKHIVAWAKSDKKLPMKQENISHFIRKQSEKVLSTSIKFHDLRHSYAIHLVQKGAPLELVAQSMGNGVKVCEKYYSGYQLTNLGIETLKRLVK